jgi:hypothetical protein
MGVKKKIVFILLILFLWQLPVSEKLVPAGHAGEKGAFTGTWVANGSKEPLVFGESRETAIFKLSGLVNLKDNIGKEKEFWANCIGLADTETGSDLRCVWRSLDGQEIYLTLKGTRMEEGSRITGSIVGGTGSVKGITGNLDFTWSDMSFRQVNAETGVSGFSKDLNGTYQIP